MLYLDLVGVFNLDLAEVTGEVNEKPRLLVQFFLIKIKFNIENKMLMTDGKTTDKWCWWMIREKNPFQTERIFWLLSLVTGINECPL